MIIETPYRQYDTVTIKTISGDELVCRFIEENGDHLTVQKPLSVVVTQQGLGLGPFVFTVNPETKIKLNKNNILFVVKTDGEMAKQYVSSVSGIKL
jgi:hypothetical protein